MGTVLEIMGTVLEENRPHVFMIENAFS